MAGFLERLKKWLRFPRKEKGAERGENTKEEEWQNPYLDDSRTFIEQILAQKGLDYRRFRPVLLDTDCPGQQFGEADDVDLVLEQLLDGLNFLEICTDRPEHFEELRNVMEREYGLLIRILPKQCSEKRHGNMVLDFERRGTLWIDSFSQDVLYLPFYKRRWRGKMAENGADTGESELDIEVPIGYNMMIVKKSESKNNRSVKMQSARYK